MRQSEELFEGVICLIQSYLDLISRLISRHFVLSLPYSARTRQIFGIPWLAYLEALGSKFRHGTL